MERRLSWVLLLAASTAGSACSGTDEAPLGPSADFEKSAASSSSAATVSGVVTDALDGRPLGGITLEIPGSASTVTHGDGSFNLNASGAGAVPLVARGDAFHTRETHVMLSGQRALIDVLPQGRGFDLDFFDHVFRNLGADHTERWVTEPRFEIWTGIYDCRSGEYEDDCDALVARGEPAPGQFVQIARDVIAADAPKYTGGVVTGTDVTTRAQHPSGTELTWRDSFEPFVVTVVLVEGIDYSFAWLWPYEDGRMYSATIKIARREHRRDDAVYSHELAHTMGFSHPASYENVPLPSIMREARAVTAQDQLHGRILYRRPPGSRTADRDPEDFSVNALRVTSEAGPPDPSLIRRVR
jgi:hypothetical protein